MPLTVAPSYSVVVSNEYFLNLNNANWGPRRGFDQNRAFIGLGYNFTSKIRTEVGTVLELAREAAVQLAHALDKIGDPGYARFLLPSMIKRG